MAPEPGRSSPAISLSRVDLPEPLTPISPVRPGPKDTVRPESTGAPSGQLKLRSEQVIAAIMARLPARRKDFRYVWRHHVAQAQLEVTRASAVSLTSEPQRPLQPPAAETCPF